MLDIKVISNSNGLCVKTRLEGNLIWSKVLNLTPYIPVMYRNSSIEYQCAYQKNQVSYLQDISIIIFWDNKPVALWPLSISTKKNDTLISSHGLPIQPPLFIKTCNKLSRKKINKICFDILENIAKELNIINWRSSEAFNQNLGFSEWHLEAMARGAKCKIEHDLFVDLNKSLDEIKSGFRKSYKSLIISEIKNWSIAVLDMPDMTIWQEFKKLHLKVAGRSTRSDDTWEIHFNDIKQGEGFLVYIISDIGRMVGGGFFNFSRDEGFYSVGAYDRELSHKPIGHIVQYQAIQELKKRKVLWYKLGVRPYTSDEPKPSDKEISISEFKQGFSSHTFPRFILDHSISRF